ncbi:MAG: hypothetical protein AB8F95_19745 [Bacteroidia bacterium]
MKKYSSKFLKQAHKESIYHEASVVKSALCGCFHCEEIFKSTEIFKWTDEGSGKEKTALCPNCGIDSVLDDKFPIQDKDFLNQMREFWF